jgi:hypothetical protein
MVEYAMARCESTTQETRTFILLRITCAVLPGGILPDSYTHGNCHEKCRVEAGSEPLY